MRNANDLVRQLQLSSRMSLPEVMTVLFRHFEGRVDRELVMEVMLLLRCSPGVDPENVRRNLRAQISHRYVTKPEDGKNWVLPMRPVGPRRMPRHEWTADRVPVQEAAQRIQQRGLEGWEFKAAGGLGLDEQVLYFAKKA